MRKGTNHWTWPGVRQHRGAVWMIQSALTGSEAASGSGVVEGGGGGSGLLPPSFLQL